MSRLAANAVRLWNAVAKSKDSNQYLREVMTSSTQPGSVSDLKKTPHANIGCCRR